MVRTLVMKFGGASVADAAHFDHISRLILQRRSEYDRVAVVVSAMGDTTDRLIALAAEVNPLPPQREYDMLLSAGERISIAILAMALAAKQHIAYSFTGSQSGIITCSNHSEARILDVKPARLVRHLDNGHVVIVAGFQGVSRGGEITTLGRGGSDTSAVALGVALEADKVEFYKDVKGVYDLDPNENKSAKLFSSLSYRDALNLCSVKDTVLHPRSIALAKKNGLPLQVRSFLTDLDEPLAGTLIHDKGLAPSPKEKRYESDEVAS